MTATVNIEVSGGGGGGPASELTQAEVDAVQLAVANGLATYDTTEIDNRAGVPNILALHSAMEANNWPREFCVARSDGPTGWVYAAAATFVAPFTITNPSGNILRMDSGADAHDLTALADSNYIWVRTTAGIPTGLYQISTRGNSNFQIDIDVGAALQSLIATTVVASVGVLSTAFPMASFTVDAGIPGVNGQVRIGPCVLGFRPEGTGSARLLSTVIGSDAYGYSGTLMQQEVSFANTVNGANTTPALAINQNSLSAQICAAPNISNSTSDPTATTADFASDVSFGIRIKLASIDDAVNLYGWSAWVLPSN